VDHAVLADPQHLPGRQVTNQVVAGDVQDHTLAGQGVGRLVARVAFAEHHGLDPVRVTEGEDPGARDHADHRVGAAHALEDLVGRGEDVLGAHASTLHGLGQGVGEDEEHGLQVAVAGHGDPARLEIVVLDLLEVRHIAVVRHGDSDGKLEPEGLRVELVPGADGRVADVTDPHMPAQPGQVLFVEDLAHEAAPLLRAELLAEGHDARGVLTAVLNREEARQQVRDDIFPVATQGCNESAHGVLSRALHRSRSRRRVASRAV
jgi:hypothetical protein